MSHYLKLLSITALSSAILVSCSNEATQVEPTAPVNEQVSAAKALTEKAAMEKAAMLEQEAQKEKEQAMAKAEAEAVAAKDAMMRAEEEAKALAAKEAKAAKEAMERAEAEAKAAKTAAEAKAAKEAMEQAEAQRRIAEEKQAALEAQRAAEAQALRDAEVARANQVREAEARQAAEAAQAAQTAATAQELRQAEVPVSPNASYNAFLSKYVSSVNGINLVAYDKVTPQDRASLQAYIQKLSAMDIEALPRDAEMATWFNLYNARTIELILENYPIKSIRKISRPWKKDRLVVNGKKMSLDDIEHGTVRKKYKEPRVHYAFNCASIGCPNVKASAWEAETLEADLAQASRDFIASERGVSIQGNKVIASSIFKWYKGDFGGNEASLLAHFRLYATGSKKVALDAATDIDKYDYDWDLNIR